MAGDSYYDPVFEWDTAKSRENRRRHRVSFEEATQAFHDPLSLTVEDPDHSTSVERRYILMGMTARGRLVAVSHTERDTRIRLISARPATRREREQYEKDTG